MRGSYVICVFKSNLLHIFNLWPSSWSPPLRSQNFMHPLILNTNLIKSESNIGYPWDSNWGPPDWKPAITTTNQEHAEWEFPYCKPTVQLIMGEGQYKKILYTHPSLGTMLETSHFPETMLVLSNSTPITYSHIGLQ